MKIRAQLIRSDFLNISNPYLPLAFFQFCEVANNATNACKSMSTNKDPLISKLAVGLIQSMRYQALERLFWLFDEEFKAVYPSTWTKHV